MNTIRCRHCAKKVDQPTGAFCPHCGKRLRAAGCFSRALRLLFLFLLLAIAIPLAVEVLTQMYDRAPQEPQQSQTISVPSPPKTGQPPTTDVSPPSGTAERVIEGASGFKSIRDSLVLIQTQGGGSGSGFVVEMDGKKWVLTNIHVVFGGPVVSISTPDGNPISFEGLEFARNRDLARLALVAPDLPSLPVSTSLPVIGQKIIAYGNSQGAAVVTQLEGTIRSVGPDEIEVTAEVVKGNSGCPIIGEQGEVLAVVYEARRPAVPETIDWTIVDTRFAETRRYALRLDRATEWVPMDSDRFYAQVALLSDIDAYMSDIVPLFNHFYTHSRDHISLSRNTADHQYIDHRFEGLLRDFYTQYNKFVDALKNIEESSKNVRSASKIVVHDEQRRMNLYRMVRRQRAQEAGKVARGLCRAPIMTLRRGQGQWKVAFLERYAQKQYRVLMFLNEQLAVLSDRFEQRKGWD